jgi:pSer/pThr/pTyr-binding forkhead associated (FHA) protein
VAPSKDRADGAAPVTGRLIVLNGGATALKAGQSVTLTADNVIGRAADSALRLDNAFVSGRHARLRFGRGRWYIADLNSTNGTLLNQEPVVAEQPVEYGDEIQIGDVRLKLAR